MFVLRGQREREAECRTGDPIGSDAEKIRINTERNVQTVPYRFKD